MSFLDKFLNVMRLNPDDDDDFYNEDYDYDDDEEEVNQELGDEIAALLRGFGLDNSSRHGSSSFLSSRPWSRGTG